MSKAPPGLCPGVIRWNAGPFSEVVEVKCELSPGHERRRHRASWVDTEGDWHAIEWADLDAWRAAVSE